MVSTAFVYRTFWSISIVVATISATNSPDTDLCSLLSLQIQALHDEVGCLKTENQVLSEQLTAEREHSNALG